ncbi:MAG TPA: Gmad2 immunoglobulin-like domain-containing protein [Candidatus Limnocylindrales bacterium]|nr:Gmad2 immunoglobulin-like domain-containing protein [Candidatus Limnocylindrales bacterium]
MTIRRSPSLVAAILGVATLLAACGGSSGPLGSVPVVSASPDPSVAQGSPDLTPGPSADPTDDTSAAPTDEPSAPAGSSTPTASPSGAPTGTSVVRAYLWLGGKPGSAGLVAVLRQVAGTKAVATAAITALLAGPTSGEKGRSIISQVPDGTQLLGLTIDAGLATIDLSSEFAAGGAGDAYQTRLAQVVYTLTQFPSVKAVAIRIEGAGDSNTLDRADYVQLLPAIWVDRPADGAAIGNPARVTGSADVFEAAFRIAVLDGSGKVLVDQQVMATCGTGCRGTFDTTIAYTIAKAQYGTFRVYEPSAQDGSAQNVRDYRVWLTPKS